MRADDPSWSCRLTSAWQLSSAWTMSSLSWLTPSISAVWPPCRRAQGWVRLPPSGRDSSPAWACSGRTPENGQWPEASSVLGMGYILHGANFYSPSKTLVKYYIFSKALYQLPAMGFTTQHLPLSATTCQSLSCGLEFLMAGTVFFVSVSPVPTT